MRWGILTPIPRKTVNQLKGLSMALFQRQSRHLTTLQCPQLHLLQASRHRETKDPRWRWRLRCNDPRVRERHILVQLLIKYDLEFRGFATKGVAHNFRGSFNAVQETIQPGHVVVSDRPVSWCEEPIHTVWHILRCWEPSVGVATGEHRLQTQTPVWAAEQLATDTYGWGLAVLLLDGHIAWCRKSIWEQCSW